MIGIYDHCPVIERNGFAVFERTVPAQDDNSPYHGMARDTSSWPLDTEEDAASRALSQEAQERWAKCIVSCSALEVVPDWPFTLRYLRHCRNLGMDAEVCFLGDDLKNFYADLKGFDVEPRRVVPMGFDCIGVVGQSYLYDDNAYSILEEERARFKQIEPELRAHRIRIRKKMRFNEYGLFLNAAGARYYAKLRRLAIESGVFDLETDEGKVCGLEDFWPEKVVCCARIIQCSDLTHV